MTSVINEPGRLGRALQTLRAIDRDLDAASRRIASGRRVDSAADGAAYWSIATTLRADRSTGAVIASTLTLGRLGRRRGGREPHDGPGRYRADARPARHRDVGQRRQGRDPAADRGDPGEDPHNAESASRLRPQLALDRLGAQRLGTRRAVRPRGVRGADGLSVSVDRLDLASVALFDANNGHAHTPIVGGHGHHRRSTRLAASINASGLGAQVRAFGVRFRLGRRRDLRLEVRDPAGRSPAAIRTASPPRRAAPPARCRAASTANSGAISSTSRSPTCPPATWCRSRFGRLAARPSPSRARATASTSAAATRFHLEIRPFAAKYPGVVYDVVVNGAVLASRGVTSLATSPTRRWSRRSPGRLGQQYAGLYDGLYPREEVQVSAYNGGGLSFAVGASGVDSSVTVTVAPPHRRQRPARHRLRHHAPAPPGPISASRSRRGCARGYLDSIEAIRH